MNYFASYYFHAYYFGSYASGGGSGGGGINRQDIYSNLGPRMGLRG